MTTEIKLYGTERCHKTQYYKSFLNEKGLEYSYFDVVANENHAQELRNLYADKKLNFPTITIGKKKLRNPSEMYLNKWISKLK